MSNSRIDRRRFVATAAAAAATGTLKPGTLGGLESTLGVPAPPPSPIQPPQQQQPPPPVPLGNGEPPALQFQAYPGGTGALMEKLWRDNGGNPFERTAIDIERWSGPVPPPKRTSPSSPCTASRR